MENPRHNGEQPRFNRNASRARPNRDGVPRLPSAARRSGNRPDASQARERPRVPRVERPRIDDAKAGDDNPQIVDVQVRPGSRIWYKKTYVAIKQPIVPEGESKDEENTWKLVSYFIPKSLRYTQQKIDLLSVYAPHTLSNLKSYNSYNEHPLCAAFRNLAEAHVLSTLQSELIANGITSGPILDVGGAAVRHHNNGNRKYVHSCVPILEPKDELRRSAIPSDARVCRHRWEECDCETFKASMSVHSLYYITPENIAKCLLKQVRPVHYAVLHEYPYDSGTMIDGEMTYERITRAEDKGGNFVKVFAHGNRTPYIHSDMSWMAPGYKAVTVDGMPFTLVWELERRFDEVCVFRFMVTRSTVPEIGVDVKELSAPTEDPRYLEVIERAIRFGEPMTEKTMHHFLRKVEREGEAMSLDPKKLVAKASAYWNSQGVILAPVTQATAVVAKERTRRLSTEYIDWLYVASVAVVTFMVAIIGILMGLGQFKAALALFCTLIFLILASNGKLPKRRLASFEKELVSLFDYCGDHITRKELDPAKVLKLKTPPREDCVPCKRAHPYVFHKSYVPMIPRNCFHNIDLCIRNKVLCASPSNEHFDLEIPQVLIETAARVKTCIVPLNWEEWVSRFPPAKQKKHRAEMKETSGHHIRDRAMNASKLFLKAEFYPAVKAPRPIHSSPVVLNYCTGRWLIPIAEALAELLPHNICFPIHGDSEKIGSFFSEHMLGKVLVQSDFSQFDSTQHERCLRLINRLMRLCGMPEEVVKLMDLDMESIKVTHRKGFKYLCKNLRLSGRSETLLGNTMLTLMTFLHCCGPNLCAILVKGDDVLLAFEKACDDIELKEVEHRVTQQGLIAKMEKVHHVDAEFCSSYFVPFNGKYVLVPKPGKMLAKAFWCKNTHYKWYEQQDQFAGILKGLASTFGKLPYISGLYQNPVYLARFKSVEMIRDQYNEYTDAEIQAGDDTRAWMCMRYDITANEFEELEKELKIGFPVELCSSASGRMIELDWGPSNDSDLLIRTGDHVGFRAPDLIMVAIEELLRWVHPLFGLLIGLYECYTRNSPYNLVMHVLLTIIGLTLSPWLSTLLHVYHNWTVSAGPKILRSVDILKTTMVKIEVVGAKQSKGKKSKSNVITVRNPKPKRKVKDNRSDLRLKAYASMIGDPCNAVPVPGVYGDTSGMVSKFKKVSISSSGAANGYIVWAPGYDGKGPSVGAGGQASCFIYVNADVDTAPLNTVAVPYGSGVAATSTSISAAGTSFIQSAALADYRTVGACVQATYTGSTVNCSGRIGYLENVPASTILYGNGGGPASINHLMQYATNTHRTSLDTMEVTYRPPIGASNLYKEDEVGAFTLGGAGVAETTESVVMRASEPTMCGFVWIGTPGSNTLAFDFFRIIEWRPDTNQGYTIPATISDGSMGYFAKATSYLDKHHPGWTHMIMGGAKTIGSKIINAAYGSIAGSFANSFPLAIKL